MEPKQSTLILMADDDADDVLLTRKALEASRIPNRLVSVRDGEELLDYLLYRGAYADQETWPRPGLVLLDLNMPRMSGKEALVEIAKHADLRRVPIVVLTTSNNGSDITEAYDLGARSYIVKPLTFDDMRQVVCTLGKYWFEIVTLPEKELCE